MLFLCAHEVPYRCRMRSSCSLRNEFIHEDREREHERADDIENVEWVLDLHCRARALAKTDYLHGRKRCASAEPFEAFGGISHIIMRLRHFIRYEWRSNKPDAATFEDAMNLTGKQFWIFYGIESVE